MNAPQEQSPQSLNPRPVEAVSFLSVMRHAMIGFLSSPGGGPTCSANDPLVRLTYPPKKTGASARFDFDSLREHRL